ncbi:MAG: hypothetical protein ACE15D_14940 [Candidatus Eisenbacteria bacterium]
MRDAIRYLRRAQASTGEWTDFWLPVGTSDAWATAFVALALESAARCLSLPRSSRASALEGARKGAAWLRGRPGPRGGWGYNGVVAADCDSTAHVVSLLARLGEPVPDESIAFLLSHRTAGGFRTYDFSDPGHEWTHPSPDVTAAAIRALSDARRLSSADLEAQWRGYLAPSRGEDGLWRGIWWVSPSYPTAMALEIGSMAGCALQPDENDDGGASPAQASHQRAATAFDLAWTLHARALVSDHQGARRCARRLLRRQQEDGGWRSAEILRVPPSHPAASARGSIVARDARRLFATASALRALALHTPSWAGIEGTAGGRRPAQAGPEVEVEAEANGATGSRAIARGSTRGPARRRSTLGRRLDRLVEDLARTLGFGEEAAREQRRIFTRLTGRSLLAPTPFPSSQISALAGGVPVEFSIDAAPQVRRALRYAVEIGDPLRSSDERARSGLATLAVQAARLGCGDALGRVTAAARVLLDPAARVPAGARFRIWGGVDAVADAVGSGGEALPALVTLKVYLNLLDVELGGGGRPRLEKALSAACLPLAKEVRDALDQLERADGYPHEVGFGLAPGGRLACKIYYQLPGWRRVLVADLLSSLGLPADPGLLVPEIPGILRESLASRSRSGIAFAIDPSSGGAIALTVAAGFPVPMLTPQETSRRVASWIEGQGWCVDSYRAVLGRLLPDWQSADASSTAGHLRMHSLFTRTLSRDGSGHATIYLRPWVSGIA